MLRRREAIHELFIEGKTFKEIGQILNSNASAVAANVARYRKEEPEKWPRLKKYTAPATTKTLVQIYKCRDCVFIFAAEKDSDLEDDVCCPVCWSNEKLDKVGTSWIKVDEQ